MAVSTRPRRQPCKYIDEGRAKIYESGRFYVPAIKIIDLRVLDFLPSRFNRLERQYFYVQHYLQEKSDAGQWQYRILAPSGEATQFPSFVLSADILSLSKLEINKQQKETVLDAADRRTPQLRTQETISSPALKVIPKNPKRSSQKPSLPPKESTLLSELDGIMLAIDAQKKSFKELRKTLEELTKALAKQQLQQQQQQQQQKTAQSPPSRGRKRPAPTKRRRSGKKRGKVKVVQKEEKEEEEVVVFQEEAVVQEGGEESQDKEEEEEEEESDDALFGRQCRFCSNLFGPAFHQDHERVCPENPNRTPPLHVRSQVTPSLASLPLAQGLSTALDISERSAAYNGAVCAIPAPASPATQSQMPDHQQREIIQGKTRIIKMFGQTPYSGTVKEYDPEGPWFRIVYDDGDEEDMPEEKVLELMVEEEPSSQTQHQAPIESAPAHIQRPKDTPVPTTAVKIQRSKDTPVPTTALIPKIRCPQCYKEMQRRSIRRHMQRCPKNPDRVVSDPTPPSPKAGPKTQKEPPRPNVVTAIDVGKRSQENRKTDIVPQLPSNTNTSKNNSDASSQGKNGDGSNPQKSSTPNEIIERTDLCAESMPCKQIAVIPAADCAAQAPPKQQYNGYRTKVASKSLVPRTSNVSSGIVSPNPRFLEEPDLFI